MSLPINERSNEKVFIPVNKSSEDRSAPKLLGPDAKMQRNKIMDSEVKSLEKSLRKLESDPELRVTGHDDPKSLEKMKEDWKSGLIKEISSNEIQKLEKSLNKFASDPELRVKSEDPKSFVERNNQLSVGSLLKKTVDAQQAPVTNTKSSLPPTEAKESSPPKQRAQRGGRFISPQPNKEVNKEVNSSFRNLFSAKQVEDFKAEIKNNFENGVYFYGIATSTTLHIMQKTEKGIVEYEAEISKESKDLYVLTRVNGKDRSEPSEPMTAQQMKEHFSKEVDVRQSQNEAGIQQPKRYGRERNPKIL